MPNPAIHTPPTSSTPCRKSLAARRSSSHPASEKSPSESPHPRKQSTSTAQPSSVAIRSASSGNDLADSCPPPRPLGKPWPMTRPGVHVPGALRGRARWPQIPTPPDRLEQPLHRGTSRLGDDAGARAVALVRVVAPVASLGQRVGPEGEEGLGHHQLVDDRRVVDVVDVVDDLRALVAEPTVVLEPGGPLHAAHSRSTPDAKTRNGAPEGAAPHIIWKYQCTRWFVGWDQLPTVIWRWLAGIRLVVQRAA